jgi:hypothetical protein
LRKFSSALIPRGMELMDSHTISLDSQFSNLILKKIAAEMKDDEYFKREDIMDGESFLDLFQTYADTLQGRSMEGTLVLDDFGLGYETETRASTVDRFDGNLMSRTKGYWDKDVTELFGINETSLEMQDIVHKYMIRAFIMVDVIQKSYLMARDEHINGKRISSEAENEPNSTDSLVDDFAVEVQTFLNGLELSSLLASLSIAVAMSIEDGTANPLARAFSIILALVNIPNAFGTMTNVSRYQNRNEEFRTEYYSTKLFALEKTLFKALSPSARETIENDSNPFITQLRNRIDGFVVSARYYNCDFQCRGQL